MRFAFDRWRILLVVKLLSFCLAGVSSLFAQSSREIVQRGKRATALVELEGGKKCATATCIHESGIFITNRHVVDGVRRDGTLKLVLQPNESGQREIQARVLRTDANWDLAVLKVADAGKFAFLSLGDDGTLYETMSVTAFGFPFGKSLAVKEGALPDISINVGRVSSLRRREGKLQQIQLDAQLNPGNSGGPILDEKGDLVGIVSSGVFATGVNFAVPVSGVRALVQRPEIVLHLPELTAATLHDEAMFRVDVVPFLDPLQDVVVELELVSAGNVARKFKAVSSEPNSFVVKAVPAVKPKQAAWPRFTARITFPAGSIVGEIEDRALKIGESALRLADVRALDAGSPWRITTRSGSVHEGNPEGLDDVHVDFGSYALTVELSQASSVQLQPIQRTGTNVSYTLTVRNGATELHRAHGTLTVAGNPSVASAAVDFVPIQTDRLVVDLPDQISDVCLGKGGQLILMYLRKTRKIAVYDVNQTKIAKYLSLGSDNVLMAAGREKLIVVSPGGNLIERWSLDTFERETTRTLSGGVIKAIALGFASTGPLLIHGAAGTEALARAHYQFYDLDSLQPMGNLKPQGRNSSYRDVVHIRASGTGDVFGLWATSHSPQGMECFVLEGNSVKASYQHDSAGHIVPNYDGTAILTGFAGVCTSDLNRKGRPGERTLPVVPSTHPRFYVTVPSDPGAQINLGNDAFKGRSAAIRLIDSDQDLVHLPSFDLGASEAAGTSWAQHDFTLDKRVHFIQQADQLVSIPFSNDKLVVQRFNVKEALQKHGVDYLFVSSTPPAWFEPGAVFRYAVHTECSKGSVTLELASGPSGMTISPGGELTWDVPAGFTEKDVHVVINVSSTDGQRTHHVFKVRNRPAG